MTTEEKRILVAKIIGPHGVRGELKLRSFTETPTTCLTLAGLADNKGKPWKLKLRATMNDHLVVVAEGVADRNAAELLKGLELFVPRSALPETDTDDAFYIEDLVGLSVRLESGAVFGLVHAVHNYGASDIIEIMVAETGKKEMFAFTEATFPTLDIEAGIITIAPPEVIE